jgi:hypothetical protein
VDLDRRRRQVALSLLVVGAAAVGFIEWAIYWSAGVLGPCFMGTAHGGRSAGALWGALIGIPLVGAVTLTGMSWRRRFLPLFLGFTLLYGAVLVSLWYSSPTIWGPERCTF